MHYELISFLYIIDASVEVELGYVIAFITISVL